MGVSEQIQEALRQGRTTEQIVELLKSKGLSEANARKFIERAQAAAASGSASAPAANPAPGRPLRPTPQVRKPAAAGDGEEGDGTWMMVQGSFFVFLGALGTALTYVMARPGGRFAILYGAVAWGFLAFGVGLMRWLRVRESRPFPVLAVGASAAVPFLIMVGIYVNTTRTRSQRKQAAVQLVREEEKRRGVEANSSSAPLDPISAYIVVVKTGAADPKAQREAVWRLGEMGQRARDAVPALLDALKSPSGEVRSGAAEALGKIDGQNPTVVSAVKVLFQDPSLDVWSGVIPGFAGKGDPDAQKVLLAKLEDPYLWARERACGILGSLRKTPAFAAPAILARLKTETDWRVRIGCARALGALGQPSAEATAVLESLATSPKSHPDLVKAASEALTKLGSARK